MTRLTALIAPDLPYNEGLFRPMQVRCPAASVVNSEPPAPIAAAHIHVALNAAEAALQCVRLALGASPDADAAARLTGWGGSTALGLSVWSGTGLEGTPDSWIMLDGSWPGSSAGIDRDGLDLASSLVGSDQRSQFQDVEILESWYPILITEKKPRHTADGAGRFRAGGGCTMGFEPWGTGPLSGEMLASRRWLPLPGAGGGAPGATTLLLIHHPDGSTEEVSTSQGGVRLQPGATFEFRCASGGGFGDPLDRDPAAVATDVASGRLRSSDALECYGVVLDDDDATDHTRRTRKAERRSAAHPPLTPISSDASEPADGSPLYPGVVQVGRVARAERSGAALAVAPDHWTDGCATIETPVRAEGPPLVLRSYLDPLDGTALYSEVVPAGWGRSFTVAPRRWSEA